MLADGAHAPGAVALDIPVARRRLVRRQPAQMDVGPAQQRHPVDVAAAAEVAARGRHLLGTRLRLPRRVDFPGRAIPSPHLSAPAAIAFMRELGVDAVRGYNHALAWEGARLLAERWGTDFSTRSRSSARWPRSPFRHRLAPPSTMHRGCATRCCIDKRIEVQLHSFRDRLYVRICGQIYNEMSDIERLADAVSGRSAADVKDNRRGRRARRDCLVSADFEECRGRGSSQVDDLTDLPVAAE